MKITCEHCGAPKRYHSAFCGGCHKFGTPLLDIPRARLRAMGVPDDLTGQDLIDFFNLPDDDDAMHRHSSGPNTVTEES